MSYFERRSLCAIDPLRLPTLVVGVGCCKSIQDVAQLIVRDAISLIQSPVGQREDPQLSAIARSIDDISFICKKYPNQPLEVQTVLNCLNNDPKNQEAPETAFATAYAFRNCLSYAASRRSNYPREILSPRGVLLYQDPSSALTTCCSFEDQIMKSYPGVIQPALKIELDLSLIVLKLISKTLQPLVSNH